MKKLEVVIGDITKLRVDAIVNAANCSLLGGGGVDGAIHAAAGEGLLKECMKIGGGKTGEAYLTGAYNLPCKYVIHTPGPIWKGGNANEDELLANSYRNSLLRAQEKRCQTIAFPCISTGVYGFPHERAANIAVNVVRDFQGDLPSHVIFCCFSPRDAEIYKKLLEEQD